MENNNIRHLLALISLSFVSLAKLSAQENDFLKQMINESFKKDFWAESLEFNPEASSDSLSSKFDINHKQTKLIELNVNKAPLPKLGYNFKFNAMLIQSLEESAEFNKIAEFNEKILAPYTNPKYKPRRSTIENYQGMIPGKTYNDLSGNGMLSLSGISGAITSCICKGNKEKKKIASVRFSESDKADIIQKTNQLIWETLYADYSKGQNDSILSPDFKFEEKSKTYPTRELRKPPY